MLNVKNLSIDIYNNRVIDNINFKIAEGKVLGIVGESGSGKSMICRSIIGINKFYNSNIKEIGMINLQGKNIIEMSERHLQKIRGKDITIIFQNSLSSLNPLKKIGKQMGEIYKIHASLSKKEIKENVINLLKAVQLANPEKIYNMYPHELSGGMAQRIVIAIAIALEPKLLIADEPTTSLDEETAEDILDLMLNLTKKNKTAILFVSHDLNVIKKISDDVLLIRNGEEIEYKTAKDFFENPESEYAKELIRCTNLEKNKGRFFTVGEKIC